jgi:hypothetical protein
MWGADQRVLAHMIMTVKVPTVVKLVEKLNDEGKCCVIGFQATGEAGNQDVSQSNAQEDDTDEINSTAASSFTRIHSCLQCVLSCPCSFSGDQHATFQLKSQIVKTRSIPPPDGKIIFYPSSDGKIIVK